MVSNTTQTQPSSSTPKHYQALMQSSLSVTAIVYIAGFVVSNSYFSLYGVFNYNLVQSRYLAAGINFLSLTLLGSLFIEAVISAGFTLKPGNIEFLILSSFLAYFQALIGYSLVASNKNIEDLPHFIVSVSPFVFWVFIVGCLKTWFDFRKEFNQMKAFKWIDTFTKKSRKVPFVAYTGLFTFAFLGAIVFGQTIWSKIPQEFGGGNPYEAVFQLDSTYTKNNNLLLISIGSYGNTSQLEILYETDKEYVVLTKPKNYQPIAVRIPKDIITQVIYAPHLKNDISKFIQVPIFITTPESSATLPPP